MIVVYREDNTPRLIPQPDHAAGAGQLAAQWRRPHDWPESIWRRFVEAVHRHDEGWVDLEKAPPLDEAGRPYTFKNLPTEQHVTVWRQGIDALTDADAYAGLILALHARWLYTQVARNDDPESEALTLQFVQWMDTRIDDLVRRLSAASAAEREATAPRRLDEARRLIGFFDMLSLVLLGGLPINDWPEPLPYDAAARPLRLYLPRQRSLAVEPWPFAAPEVTITMAAYDVGQQTFESPEALGRRLAECGSVTLAYTLAPRDG